MSDSTAPQPRVVISADDLRHLAHPIRWKLWESLIYDGPGTSTTLAERVHESSGSTSYHLRQLERLGLIEEIVDRGNQRDRWWRVVPGAYRVAATDAGGAHEAVQARSAQSATDRYLHFVAWAHTAGPTELPWVDAAFNEQTVLELSAADLEELSGEVEALLARWLDRQRTSDPQARRVEVLVRAFPRSFADRA